MQHQYLKMTHLKVIFSSSFMKTYQVKKKTDYYNILKLDPNLFQGDMKFEQSLVNIKIFITN
jgi:hypothetical protein